MASDELLSVLFALLRVNGAEFDFLLPNSEFPISNFR